MRDIQHIQGRVKQVHVKTKVGALSGPDCGITEHGREPAFGQCYPVCLPPNVLRPLSKPLFDQEAVPKGRVRGGGLEILGPVKAGKNKGKYVVRAKKGGCLRPSKKKNNPWKSVLREFMSSPRLDEPLFENALKRRVGRKKNDLRRG